MDNNIKSAWLVTYTTNTFKGKETRTQIFYLSTENFTPNDISRLFRNDDVILFIHQLEYK